MATDANPDAPTEEQPADATTEEEDEEFDEARAREKIRKSNNEAKNLRDRLKVAEAKAAKLDELEEAQKSELEKATARADRAEAEAKTAATEALKLRVAIRHNLPEDLAVRLIGTTEEELDEDAQKLLATVNPEPETRDPLDQRPRPKLRTGVSTEDDLDEDPLLRDLKAKAGVR